MSQKKRNLLNFFPVSQRQFSFFIYNSFVIIIIIRVLSMLKEGIFFPAFKSLDGSIFKESETTIFFSLKNQ